MHISDSLPKRRNGAFTLLEIMVVLAILGLLAGLVITDLGHNYDQAQVDTARLFVNTSIEIPLTSYKMHMGDYPTTEQGLQALITPPSSDADSWRGPYLKPATIPLDPWHHPYNYAYPGKHNANGYDIWSNGKDGQSGTDDDIGNWDNRSANAQKQ